MRIAVLSVVSFILFCSPVFSQDQDTIQQRIVLIGDAGQFYKGHHPVVDAVKKNIKLDSKTTVVYLGDNLYKVGLPDDQLPTYATAKAVLDTQLSIVDGTDAKLFFIPGNHDWAGGGVNGYESIIRQQLYVDRLAVNHNRNIEYQPKDGCPGPVEVNIGGPNGEVVLVIVDSQWWLHEYSKPGIESDCPYKTKSEVLTQLKDILDRNFKKLVVLAMHHPFRSYGSHGSYYGWKQHLFPFTESNPKLYIPLPIIGSIYPLVRGVFGTTQDLKHPVYQEMVNDFEQVLKGHPNVIMTAGHEHSMQYIQDSARTYIVSGSGSKAYRVSKSKNSLFSKMAFGFAVLDVNKNKTVTCHIYTVDQNTGETKREFDHSVLDFSKLPAEIAIDTTRTAEALTRDSALISASDKYKNPSGIRKFMLGENYRAAWSTPIKLKILKLNSEKGGLDPLSVSGGKQTKSLLLKERSKSARQWVLRGVDKDPELVVPESLRGTLAVDIVKDLVSGTYPYAPLVVAELAKNTGVLQATPQLFYVPDDYRFTYYRKLFSKTIATFEEKETLNGNALNQRSTSKVISKLIEDPDHRTDQVAYLRARLLDMEIGDWERHPDQWRWNILDTGKGKLYYPVPRNRDQAFFNSEGLLMRYIRKNKLRYLQGFRRTIPNINWLNYEARDIDRIFLNKLDDKAWVTTLREFTEALTDSVIHNSVLKLPPEIYPLDGAELEIRLQKRRDILFDKAIQYYKFISKKVTITGSNEREYFKVRQNGESLNVRVFKRTALADTGEVIYERDFDPRVTKEIRIFGLNGNDLFFVDPSVKSTIKLRIIGGRGNDTFNVAGNIKNRLYDLKSETNLVVNSKRSAIKFSDEIAVNEYNPYGFKYDEQRFPKLLLGYNVEDKLLLGVGFSRKNYGFRKEPYASDVNLSGLFAPSSNAYKVNLSAVINTVIGHNDVILNAELVNPVLNNFFGIGNNTKKDDSRAPEYYRVRFNYFMGEALLRRRKNDFLSIAAGPMFYRYWNHFDDNKTRILATPASVGLDSANVYSHKSYVGAKAGLYINFVNNELFPTRGIIWNSELQALAGASSNAKSLVRAHSDMMVPIPIIGPTTLYVVLKVGGGHIFSKNYEYFQAFNLGANNFLRGFRKNRFQGSSMAYGNVDLRLKLFKSTSYILPGDLGITGFVDAGKVWAKGVSDKTWHTSYGGGFYFTPFNLFVVSASMGFSKEDQLFNFSLGTKFNLTF